MLSPRGGHALSECGVPQKIEAACGAFFRTRHEIPGDSVLDLNDDAADLPGHHRNALPEPLGDHKTESLAKRLLDHDLGRALECVHLAVLDAVQVCKEEDVFVTARVFACP